MNWVIFIILISVFLITRNDFVLDARVYFLEDRNFPDHGGLELHECLPSYDAMLYNPWYWLIWTGPQWHDWLSEKGHIGKKSTTS